MADDTSSSPFDQDFDAIQAAVLETARGRWFLAEFARRNRVAETDKLLGAIQRLERTGEDRDETAPALPPRVVEAAPSGAILDDLKELLESVAATNAAVQAVEPADLGRLVAPDAKGFDRVVDSPGDAHGTILAAAEQIQETVWMLREQGAAPRLCDELDRRATQVFAACAYGELAANRTAALAASFAALVEQSGTIARRHGLSVGRPPQPARPTSRARRAAKIPPAPAAPALPSARVRDAGLVPSLQSRGMPLVPQEASQAAAPSPAPPKASVTLRDAAARLLETATRITEGAAGAPDAAVRRPDTVPPYPPAGDRSRRPTTLADIDALTAREKLRLFT